MVLRIRSSFQCLSTFLYDLKFDLFEYMFSVLVDDGKVEKRSIKVRSKDGNQVMVEAGVRAGENLVVDPPGTLENGSAVVVDTL